MPRKSAKSSVKTPLSVGYKAVLDHEITRPPKFALPLQKHNCPESRIGPVFTNVSFLYKSTRVQCTRVQCTSLVLMPCLWLYTVVVNTDIHFYDMWRISLLIIRPKVHPSTQLQLHSREDSMFLWYRHFDSNYDVIPQYVMRGSFGFSFNIWTAYCKSCSVRFISAVLTSRRGLSSLPLVPSSWRLLPRDTQ